MDDHEFWSSRRNPQAEKERDELGRELRALHRQRDAELRLLQLVLESTKAEVESLRAAVERVRQLHPGQIMDGEMVCPECSETSVSVHPWTVEPWPCPTVRALDGTA